ncbi:hypothetical protein [Halolamina rubra]|uniref:hypothetical protein n=1 Tax=Halolamina rubra TaxID=1380430 RepID=UPI0006787538|nr:hypothetical protein [Halolamina rubra]
MVDRSRRTLLAAVAGVTTLAGCGGGETSSTVSPSDSEQPTESPSSTTTESSTATATPPPLETSDLAFSVNVVRQASEDAPGKVRASLTNRLGRAVRLVGGHLIPVSGGVADGSNDALLLLPEESDRINDYSWTRDGDPEGRARLRDATYDGCWRAPGDGFLRTDLADAAELSDGETVEAEFYPLAPAGADCPQGSYTVQEELSVEGTDQSIHTELTLDVAAEGSLAVEGSLSVGDTTGSA